jgi:hypothetical protein
MVDFQCLALALKDVVSFQVVSTPSIVSETVLFTTKSKSDGHGALVNDRC